MPLNHKDICPWALLRCQCRGASPGLGGPCWCFSLQAGHGGDAPAPVSCRHGGCRIWAPRAGGGDPERWVQGVTEILWKRGGSGVLSLAACPMSPGAGREKGQGKCFACFSSRTLLSSRPRVPKVTLPCSPTSILVPRC